MYAGWTDLRFPPGLWADVISVTQGSVPILAEQQGFKFHMVRKRWGLVGAYRERALCRGFTTGRTGFLQV
jgi:hypothetical protein